MKRSSLISAYLAGATMAASVGVAADVTPLMEFSVGAGSWMTEYSGQIGDENNRADVDALDVDDTNNNFFYARFEHPVPFVPNIRLDHVSISTSGTGTLESSYTLGDETFTAGTEVASDWDLSMTDVALYYELAILDFGLNFRQFDVEIMAEEGSSGRSAKESADLLLPMVFLQADVALPLTGLYVMGNVNAIAVDDKSITDYRAAVGYTIDLSVLSEVGLEIGYRGFEIDLGEDEDIAGEVEMSGVYFGANITF